MSKKVLVLSASLRAGGNSDTLADEFVRGARDAGHQVEKVALRDKTIGFCKGCLACQSTRRCVIHDDGDAIAQQMLEADVIAFATPIYYYGMCGQMKTMLDRANPLFTADYRFRDIYLLAAAAERIAALPALALPVAGVLILAALSLLSFAVSCSIFEKEEP